MKSTKPSDKNYKNFDLALDSAETAYKDGDTHKTVKLLRPILATASRLQEPNVGMEDFPPQLPRALEISGEMALSDENYLVAKNHFENLALIWDLIAKHAEGIGSTKHASYAHDRADAARVSAESAINLYHQMIGALVLKGFSSIGRGLSKFMQNRRQGKSSGGPHIKASHRSPDNLI